MKEQNNWRNQLKSRKISPSDEAWLSIESGLERKSKNKLKRNFVLSLIAASLIGFIVFVSLPTNSNLHSNLNIASEIDEQPEAQTVFPAALFINADTALHFQGVETIVENIDVKNHISNPSNSISKPHKTNVKKKPASNTNTPNTQFKATRKAKVQTKAAQLLAEVEADLAEPLSNPTKLSAEDEADLLLAEAKQIILEVEYDRLYEFAQASELLAEVEGDLSKDKLQNRVWHFVKSNFQNLENALVSLR